MGVCCAGAGHGLPKLLAVSATHHGLSPAQGNAILEGYPPSQQTPLALQPPQTPGKGLWVQCRSRSRSCSWGCADQCCDSRLTLLGAVSAPPQPLLRWLFNLQVSIFQILVPWSTRIAHLPLHGHCVPWERSTWDTWRERQGEKRGQSQA